MRRRRRAAAIAPALPRRSAYCAEGRRTRAGHIRKFEEMELEIIRMAIARYEGHMSEVARRLGIGRSTLYRKLKEFGLEPELATEPMAKVARRRRRAASADDDPQGRLNSLHLSESKRPRCRTGAFSF